MTKTKAVLLALVAVLLLSGCEVKAELVVKADGSGTFSYLVGIDKSFLARLDPGTDPLGTMRKNAASQPYKVTVTDFENDKEKGLRATFDFSGIDDLKQKLASSKAGATQAAGGETASPPGFAFDVLGLGETRDGWKLAANAGVSPEARKQLPFNPSQLRSLLEATFTATLPGHAGANNATRVSRSGSDTTFTWDLLAGEGNIDLKAQTSSKSKGFPVGAVLLPVAIALIAAGLLMRRRAIRRLAASSAAPPPPPGPPPAPPPPGPPSP